MNSKVEAFQIAESINIRACKIVLNYNLDYHDIDELFYEISTNQYVYLFRYGVVVFFNLNSQEQSAFLKSIENHCNHLIPNQEVLNESLEIETGNAEIKADFKSVAVPEVSSDVMRLIMLNVSQSVALDQYALLTEQILEDTKKHTIYLEANGKLDIGGKKLKKYIARVLNIKNKISENLYIFDTPEAAWEDEGLNQLNTAVKKLFDLKDRHLSIHHQLNIIKENLDLFKDIMFHKESSKLEWIIIILIVIEVVDLLILKAL